MTPTDPRYSRVGLCRDMLAAADVIRHFDPHRMAATARALREARGLFLTGEGSSRIFPAKSIIAHARRAGWPVTLHTDAARQALEYDLSDWAVFALSNSGRTAEVIGLFSELESTGHAHRYSLTAFPNSKLESLATQGYVLSCGPESAVAATKSVIEQALFYRALLEAVVEKGDILPSPQNAGPASQTSAGESRVSPISTTLGERCGELADAFHHALTLPIDPALVQRIASAGTIYWAGRNDGVAEELTLKTNEITRKPADYLEGTYAVHGVEEVMNGDDVLIWVDPYHESEQKFADVLVKGVGLSVVAIAARDTRFPTIRIPDAGDLSPFVQMAAGWNLLVEIGLALGIDLDKPLRARKVGNEFTG